jgi:hypothetical protein
VPETERFLCCAVPAGLCQPALSDYPWAQMYATQGSLSKHQCMATGAQTLSLKCWGSNDYGELGLPLTYPSYGDSPGQMGASMPNITVPGDLNQVQKETAMQLHHRPRGPESGILQSLSGHHHLFSTVYKYCAKVLLSLAKFNFKYCTLLRGQSSNGAHCTHHVKDPPFK